MNFFTKNLNEKKIFFYIVFYFCFLGGRGEGSKVSDYSELELVISFSKNPNPTTEKMCYFIFFFFVSFFFFFFGGGGGGGEGGGSTGSDFFTKNPNLFFFVVGGRGREVAWEGARVSEFLKLRIQIK